MTTTREMRSRCKGNPIYEGYSAHVGTKAKLAAFMLECEQQHELAEEFIEEYEEVSEKLQEAAQLAGSLIEDLSAALGSTTEESKDECPKALMIAVYLAVAIAGITAILFLDMPSYARQAWEGLQPGFGYVQHFLGMSPSPCYFESFQQVPETTVAIQ